MLPHDLDDLFLAPGAATVWVGDAREVLPSLPADSFGAVVTSPPYFGAVRDYGTGSGQLGSETTIPEYLGGLLPVFDAVRRVARPDAPVWVNLGDGYHRKRLLGVPWRFALAMAESGWTLWREVLWEKPNCLPQPVTDRCVTSHEYVFLFTKGKPPTVGLPAGTGEVWTIPTTPRQDHFATFPERLALACLDALPAGTAVLDPFGGSGTVGVAAARLGLPATLVELNPAYAALAAARCGGRLTGRTPT